MMWGVVQIYYCNIIVAVPSAVSVTMLSTTLFLIMWVANVNYVISDGAMLKANETEMLAVMNVQAVTLPHMKDAISNYVHSFSKRFKAVPDIFLQQQSIYPDAEALQLPNFGASIAWSQILSILQDNPSTVLLVMIRHGEAWENINPLGNDACEFDYNGQTIENFDSALDPRGIQQAIDLNTLLRSYPEGRFNDTSTATNWYETMGLSGKPFICSPLTRTLQTAMHVLDTLPVPGVIASELIRASIGHDVCNYRRNVATPTDCNQLPAPWNTGCGIPSDSLREIYSSSSLNFTFPIRPVGGAGFGLIADNDILWRSDATDDTHEIRARAFLEQVYEYRSEFMLAGDSSLPVVGVVTHGETISAVYEATGAAPYSPRNTQVVPLLVEYL
jgi:phosphohistidine phosphatase SixA